MYNIMRILSLLLVVVFMAGCATNKPLTFDQIRGLKRCDSLQYVHGILKKPAMDSVNVEYNGDKYLVEFAQMETGEESIPVPIIVPPFYGFFWYHDEKKENYIYMYKEYEDGEYKLYDWGFIPDLNKSDSKVTRNVVIEAEDLKAKQKTKG